MDYSFSKENEEFRQNVREFVKSEWDSDLYHMNDVANASWHLDDPKALAALREFQRKLSEKGWFTMHWPEEYGGQSSSFAENLIYREEMAYQGLPISSAFSGDSIIMNGTDWQKSQWLPSIKSGEMRIAQGLSEPGNGSDLAGVQTRAVKDGDDWVINGQKMWTSTAHMSNWIMMLVRTDTEAPKHRGLSIFYVPLDSKGITIRPLYDMAGRRRWSEEFFEDVRVPSTHMLGEENRGWYVMASSLTTERVEVGSPAALLREWERFVSFAKTYKVNGEPILHDPVVRNSLADMRVKIMMFRMLCYNGVWESREGKDISRISASARVLSGELVQELWRGLTKILGNPALVMPGTWSDAPMNGFIGVNALMSTGRTFGHGTKEIQRNILAQRGLGLPR